MYIGMIFTWVNASLNVMNLAIYGAIYMPWTIWNWGDSWDI